MYKINFAEMHWNVIAYCEREDVWGNKIPAEWFIKDGTFATREDAEAHQKAVEESTRGTDAEWPEANATAKIVHDDELGQYGLKPLNEKSIDDETADDIRAEKAAYDAEVSK